MMAEADRNRGLTVIISFLNEGEEVRRTVSSVFETSNGSVDVIVINDGSNGLYDYEKMLCAYPEVKYLKNDERLGTPVCRDMGVRLSTTPYFMLIDAHMRFYDNNWAERIVSYLKEDDRRLLCCQTRALVKDECGDVVQYPGRRTSYGAYINFEDDDKLLSPKWIYDDRKCSKEAVEDVPCILGATYSASKRYWTYLRGYEGLRLYGYEEPYVSIKAWLEGGRCQLIKDIEIGHIYRTKFPYRVDRHEMMYNRMWIAAVLLPDDLRDRVYDMGLRQDEPTYCKVMEMLDQEADRIDELKDYYRKISVRDFSYIENVNTIKNRSL